ncbi:porin family protein [Olleya sp. UBA1516]|uniref:porin family protein n=1 Tax=Olleya sp. UBA1516 TaxID=1947013 RepID=UPI0025FF5F88|nr:porin family protein [Olleya sp. UBA1516]|tara:strand:- start:1452 stop:2072 length:621 start_codon:yes stop_codon:yes gene_type:complete
MKKLFTIAAVAVLGMTSVNAQDINFGAKAGVNFATVGGDVEDVDARTSFHVGVVAEIMISDKFSVQPELMYSSQGFGSEYSDEILGTTVNYEETLKLDYINLPVMAKYYVTEGLSLEAGPQIGFLMSADYEFEASAGGDSESESEDVKDDFKSIDFGFGAGLGYKLENGLNFSARYTLGLANIAEDAEEDFSIQNNVFQVSVGFFF